MFYGFLLFIFAVLCLMLIGIILVQASKSGGMGTAMGGAAVQAAFGGQGADKLLTRITIGLAVGFMVLALAINIVGAPGSGTSNSDGSIISQRAQADASTLAAPIDLTPTPSDNIKTTVESGSTPVEGTPVTPAEDSE